MFCEKYLEIQIKSYNKKVTTNFGNVENNSNKPPRKNNQVHLPVVHSDYVFKTGTSYKNVDTK